MIDGEKVLAVIPARGGSKRFPRKNLALFRGRPLIAWAIMAARKSRYIDTVVCSSDDVDIEIAALMHGCLALRRPAELATDEAKCEEAARHVMGTFRADWVVLLQPTSPLRTVFDIDKCIEIANNVEGAVVSYNGQGKPNGAVYVATSRWLRDNDFTAPHTRYLMPDDRSLDINTREDMDACLSRDSKAGHKG